MLIPVGPFRRIPNSAIQPAIDPLGGTIAGPFIYLRSDIGVSGNEGDSISLWPDQSGNSNDLTVQIAPAHSPILRLAASPTGKQLLEFYEGACSGANAKRMERGAFSWPQRLTDGYTFYYWFYFNTFNICTADLTAMGGGGTNRPRLRLAFSAGTGDKPRLDVTDDGVPWDLATKIGTQAVHTLSITVSKAASPVCHWFLDGVEDANSPHTFSAWVSAAASGLYLGNETTTTPLVYQPRTCNCRIGSHIGFAHEHTPFIRRGIEKFLVQTFGQPG